MLLRPFFGKNKNLASTILIIPCFNPFLHETSKTRVSGSRSVTKLNDDGSIFIFLIFDFLGDDYLKDEGKKAKKDSPEVEKRKILQVLIVKIEKK